MYERPSQDGQILSRAVPVGIYHETDAHGNHKLGAAIIRVIIAFFREDIGNELRRWLADDVPHLWPPIDMETRKHSSQYLTQSIKGLIDCVSIVAELKGGRRVDYVSWLVVYQMGKGFAYNRGGITGIILHRPNIGKWLSRHGQKLDLDSVSSSVLSPFFETFERLLWQTIHYYCVEKYGQGFFLDRESYYALISDGGF